MVKKDNIQNATQNCPTPFLGRFNYTFNDGSTTYCDGTSVWDVCSDRTQMVVNYTLCSTQQFYSSDGVAYCAYSTSVGSTYYVTVINADISVDFSSTFRFTCYAVTTSGGKIFASDNKGACGQNQSPTTKMSTGAGTLEFVAYETCRVQGCTLPTDWDGEWHDSSDTTQDIKFTRSDKYVVGWKHQIYSYSISSWTCVADQASENLLLFKSNQTAVVFGGNHNVYRCIKWQKLTDYSYTYLIHANIESNAGNARVLVQSITDTINISYACNLSQALPTAVETVVMVKKDNIQNATQNCPSPFLGSFNYTFNDGSTTYCDGTSVWDVCSDRTQMVVNYTLCSTQQFYSSGGVGYCAYSTSVGSTYYVTVINADTTVDFSSTFRFTCYAVTTSCGKVVASDNKGACGQNQSPTTKMSTGAGTLEFVAYETCPFTSPSASESSSNIGIIAGAVRAVLGIAIAAAVGIIIYKKLKRQRESPATSVYFSVDPAVTPEYATVIEPP